MNNDSGISTGVYLKSTLHHGLGLLALRCDAYFSPGTFYCHFLYVCVCCTRNRCWCLFFFGNNNSLLVSYFGSFVTHSHSQKERSEQKRHTHNVVGCLMCVLFGRLLYSEKVLFYLDSSFFFLFCIYCWMPPSLFTVNDMRFKKKIFRRH